MKPNPVQPPGEVSIRVLAALALLSILPILLFASPPGWWSTRNVTTGGTANDYSVANQGQLKNIATAAFNELGANLPGGVGDMTAPSGTFPGGTGYQLTALINSWSTTTSGTMVEITGSSTNDYAAVNLGQLKHATRPFYKRLIEAGFATYYPWEQTGASPNDYAVANIGQVKNLFSFDITTASDSDGVPDMWEMNWFGTIGISGTSLAPSGNGLTVYQAYEDGVSPLDYYEGVSPTITIVSGSGQTGAPGAMLPSPLVVQVTGTSGSPMVNAPVNFSVIIGSGLLAPDNSGTSATSSSLQMFTGTNGYAQVYFQQPSNGSFTSSVAAFAEGSEADMNENSSAATRSPTAPTNVTADVWPDGSVVVKWIPTTFPDYFDVQYSPDGGTTWITTGTVLALDYVVPSSVGIAPGSPIRVVATGTGTLRAIGTAISGSVPAILPVPIDLYGTINISGSLPQSTYHYVGSSNEPYVLSMALGDNGQAAYCCVSGTLSSADSWGNALDGAKQITVIKWNNGAILSDTINCDAPSAAMTMDGTWNVPGLKDESINADPSLYQAASWSVTPPYGTFYYNWIENPYVLNPPPPSVALLPNGNAYGTAIDDYFINWSGTPYAIPTEIENAFSWTWSGTAQPKQNLVFTGTAFTSSGTNLLTNNIDVATFYESEYSIGPWGDMVLGCSQAGYFGVGAFGVTSGTGYNGWADYLCDPGGENDFLIASYIYNTTSGTHIFYDPSIYPNSALYSSLPTSSTFTATNTAFTPAAMNDNGYAIGGQYYWNGTSLNSLSDSTAVGTAISSGTGPNLGIGYDTASGTAGMLWVMNGASAAPITMQSLIANTSFKGEIQNVIPIAISGTDSNNMVSILCSGSVMEIVGDSEDGEEILKSETLRIRVNAATPSNTATPPLINILKLPWINAIPSRNITSGGDVWGVGAMYFSTRPVPSEALVSTKAEFKLISGTNVFQGWDSTDEDRPGNNPTAHPREPWTTVCLPTTGQSTNSLVKLNLSDIGPVMNLELVVAPGSDSYISLSNNTISGTETDFNIVGLAATGTYSNGKDRDAQIIVREKGGAYPGPHGPPLATLHVYVLPPQSVHFAIFYSSDDSNPNTALPAVSGTQAISDDINATFNPQANVTFICDGTFRMGNLKNIFVPTTGELPCDSGTLPQPPQWTTIENLSKVLHPDPQQYTLWRIFVVNKLQDGKARALTANPRYGLNNFTFINADSIPRVYSHEAGRALQVSQDGPNDWIGIGPFDMGPWPLEFRWDGLQLNGQNVETQVGLMSNSQGVLTQWIHHEYWNKANKNTHLPPFK